MIAQNAGAEGSIVVAKVRESKDKNFGYNAATDTYEDLVKAGVIDPTKVTRTALQNAASIAGLAAHHRVRGGGEEGRQAGPGGCLRAAAWAGCTRQLSSPAAVSRAPRERSRGALLFFHPRGSPQPPEQQALDASPDGLLRGGEQIGTTAFQEQLGG